MMFKWFELWIWKYDLEWDLTKFYAFWNDDYERMILLMFWYVFNVWWGWDIEYETCVWEMTCWRVHVLWESCVC
jgi:hypothetical protein